MKGIDKVSRKKLREIIYKFRTNGKMTDEETAIVDAIVEGKS